MGWIGRQWPSLHRETEDQQLVLSHRADCLSDSPAAEGFLKSCLSLAHVGRLEKLSSAVSKDGGCSDSIKRVDALPGKRLREAGKKQRLSPCDLLVSGLLLEGAAHTKGGSSHLN